MKNASNTLRQMEIKPLFSLLAFISFLKFNFNVHEIRHPFAVIWGTSLARKDLDVMLRAVVSKIIWPVLFSWPLFEPPQPDINSNSTVLTKKWTYSAQRFNTQHTWPSDQQLGPDLQTIFFQCTPWPLLEMVYSFSMVKAQANSHIAR